MTTDIEKILKQRDEYKADLDSWKREAQRRFGEIRTLGEEKAELKAERDEYRSKWFCLKYNQKPEHIYPTEPKPNCQNVKEDTPLNEQVGGNHYKDMAIQPAEYIAKNNIGFFEGCVIKYVSRHEKKNGAEDIDKSIHFLKMLKHWKYGSYPSPQNDCCSGGKVTISIDGNVGIGSGPKSDPTKFIYVASPFTSDSNAEMEKRTIAVCEYTGHLMKNHPEWVVFSPIAHSAIIARFNDMPVDEKPWRPQNEWYINHCHELHVLCIPGWSKSKGVTWEIDYARKREKKIAYIVPTKCTNGDTYIFTTVHEEALEWAQ